MIRSAEGKLEGCICRLGRIPIFVPREVFGQAFQRPINDILTLVGPIGLAIRHELPDTYEG